MLVNNRPNQKANFFHFFSAVMEPKTVRFLIPENERKDFPSDYEQITLHLKSVFTSKQNGDAQKYAQLLDAIQSKTNKLSSVQMLELIRALSLFVTVLDHKLQPLVNAILAIDWLDNDKQFINSYLHLLQNLVSAHSVYITPVCKMIVEFINTGLTKLTRPCKISKYTYICLV